jgi:hypothetical protein
MNTVNRADPVRTPAASAFNSSIAVLKKTAPSAILLPVDAAFLAVLTPRDWLPGLFFALLPILSTPFNLKHGAFRALRYYPVGFALPNLYGDDNVSIG